MTGRVEGKVVWIAGAGLGPGRESARRLAAEDAHVICADIDAALAEEAAAEVGGRAITQAARDESSFVTGAEMVVDCGYLMVCSWAS